MPIQDYVNNTKNNVGDTITDLLNRAKTAVENIVGTATTGFTSLWSGGFTGMGYDGMLALVQAIDQYCDTLEATIDQFNEEASRDNAYKGDINEAVGVYVDAMQAILKAYVSTIRKETEEAAAAYRTMNEAQKGFAQNTTDDASAMEQNAQSIRVESTNVSLD